jgi:hypothetical protein
MKKNTWIKLKKVTEARICRIKPDNYPPINLHVNVFIPPDLIITAFCDEGDLWWSPIPSKNYKKSHICEIKQIFRVTHWQLLPEDPK